jgi:pyridoxal phosphate enzyme (YggS family)
MVLGLNNRRDEIAANLAAVRERIAAACVAAGRDRGSVTLVAVTKTYPASDVVHLAHLGVRDVGENRDQEAAPKAVEVAAALDPRARPTWHFVGQLQRNKCRSVVTYAGVVHSIDSVRLARALAGAAAELRERPLDALVQVSLDGDLTRGGAAIHDGEEDRSVDRVAAEIAASPSLRLAGVMAVAPLHGDALAAFATLAMVSQRLQKDYPKATIISAGMSGDLEEAVAHGATHVRIGSALLGNRPVLG